MAWNPKQYLEFGVERLGPAQDLLALRSVRYLGTEVDDALAIAEQTEA